MNIFGYEKPLSLICADYSCSWLLLTLKSYLIQYNRIKILNFYHEKTYLRSDFWCFSVYAKLV